MKALITGGDGQLAHGLAGLLGDSARASARADSDVNGRASFGRGLCVTSERDLPLRYSS
jgi:hypothetical protein